MSDDRYRRYAHVLWGAGRQTWHLSLLTAGGLASRQLSTPLLGDGPHVETLTLFSAVGGTQRASLDAVSATIDADGFPNDPLLDEALLELQYTGLQYGKWNAQLHNSEAITFRLQAPTNRAPAAIRAILDQAAGRRFLPIITTRPCFISLDLLCGTPTPIGFNINPPYVPRSAPPAPPAPSRPAAPAPPAPVPHPAAPAPPPPKPVTQKPLPIAYGTTTKKAGTSFGAT